MDDQTKARQAVIDRLYDAQKILMPLFAVTIPSKFEVDEVKTRATLEELTDIENGEIVEAYGSQQEYERMLRGWFELKVTFPSGLVKTYGYFTNPNNIGIGISASDILYRVANPSVYAIGGIKLVTLRNIIGNSGGIAYVTLKGFDLEQELRSQQSKSQQSLIDQTAAFVKHGDFPHLVSTVFSEELSLAEIVARKLNSVRRTQVIPEIVPLDFDLARSYIRQHAGIDIMDPPYVGYIGRMQKPPERVM